MDEHLNLINKYLVAVYNDMIKIEEHELNQGIFSDISLTEMHTVEAIGMYDKPTMSEVAKNLGITVGTLTVAINNLTKKEYVQRFKSEDDRRVVRLGLTKKGRLLYRVHDKFHKEMIKKTITGLSDEEIDVLVKGLKNLHLFLLSKYESGE